MFQDVEDIQKCDDGSDKTTSQHVFQKRYKQWQDSWAKCTAAEENYV